MNRAPFDETPPESSPQRLARDDPFGEGPAAAKARRHRSVVIALALAAFVILVFINSLLKLSAHSHHG